MTSQKILVTGATGNVATLVLSQLKQKGADVRVLVRNEAKAKGLKDQGFEVAIGDFNDKASLEKALAGVDTTFLVTPAHPEAFKWAQTFLDAASKNKAMRIVRLSVIGAGATGPTENVKQHGQADEAVRTSGHPYTLLRPHFFMQNMMMSGESIMKAGQMFWGMGEGKLGLIDTRDIADCAVACLLDAGWNYSALDLTGPASISFHDVAKAFTKALGKEVTYVPVPPAAVEKSIMDMGMGQWFATAMRNYSEAYAANWGNYTNGMVQKLTGHEARSIDAFASEVFAPMTKK